MGIFKAYDVRGIYPDEVDEEKVRRIGFAFVRYLGGKPSVVVGRDIRLHSAALKEALVGGLVDAGASVTDIGICTTPMNYFAIGSLEADGGLMVTASHNPPEYNGLKICRRAAAALSYEGGLAEIEKLYETDEYLKVEGGSYRARSILEDYKEMVRSAVAGCKRIRVAVDTANGAVGLFVEELFGRTPIEVVGLYLEPDGEFPNHEPNPLKDENLRDLQRLVVEEKCDFGVAFDGDGDRCRFVTEKGEVLGADIITALIASRRLKGNEGAKIVYDLRSSRVVPEEIEKAGGIPVRCCVGHAYMKEVMRAEDALFGGELSGHFYFRENFYADSGMLIFASVAQSVSKEGRLSDIVRPLMRYYATGELNYKVEDKDAVIEKVFEHYSKTNARLDRLDGVTVSFDEWWFNLRKSNTEPLIRLNLEAETEELMNEKREEVERLMER